MANNDEGKKLLGERFDGERVPAWRALGTVIQKPGVKPAAAMKKYGLDYQVGVFPTEAVVADNVRIPTGKVAIMRSPMKGDDQWRYFGTAGAKYELVQNLDLAATLEPISQVWPLETIGQFDNGKTVFMSFGCGAYDIAGDPVEGYFLGVDVKDGGTRVKFVYTPIRTRCKNTLMAGLRSGVVAISVAHISGAKDQLAARVALIAKAQKAREETDAAFRQLAETRITPKQAELMFEAVYPLPKTPEAAALVDWSEEDLGALLFKGVANTMYDYNYYVKQQQDLRYAASELYERMNDENKGLAGTAWNAWNAVVELADFRQGGKNPDYSALFGPRAREKKAAFTAAMAYVK